MNSLVLLTGTVVAYLAAYRLYGRYLGRKIFRLTSSNSMPAHDLCDGIDFIPSKKHIVLGHHFTTIAGLGPIVGPAIGIIWGWLPAFIWVLFGSIFMGAVHDFAAMAISARNQGRTIGDLTGTIISPATKLAFQVIIQFLLWIVVSIFAMIMGVLFQMYPEAVLPIVMQIPIALWLGRQLRRGKSDLLCSLIAVALMFAFVVLGLHLPIILPPILGSAVITWTLLLFVYVFVAATLPVDMLLQPRDYINSHQLLIVMALLTVGILIAHPAMTAPAINPAATAPGNDIPPLFPLLFITIACGAISGFHSLAASGTASKQVTQEQDILSIGYGGMLLEGVLATIALIAIAGGLGMGLDKGGVHFTGAAAFNAHYASWAAAQGLGPKIGAFVTGAANMMACFGLSREFGTALMAVFIVSFAGTTLDSATRIQRLTLQELCTNRHGKILRPLDNRFAATFVVVVLAALLTFVKPGAGGALILWPLFGALNQLLAALGLTVATVYLARKGRNYLVTMLPMLFMLLMTGWAMLNNLRRFVDNGDTILIILSLVIFGLTGWLLVGAISSLQRLRQRSDSCGPEVAFEQSPERPDGLK